MLTTERQQYSENPGGTPRQCISVKSQVKLLIPLMRFAFCKEQTAQAKRNAFCMIMVYFSVAPPTFVGWADCM